MFEEASNRITAWLSKIKIINYTLWRYNGSIGPCCCYHDSKFDLFLAFLSAGRAGRSEDAEKGLI